VDYFFRVLVLQNNITFVIYDRILKTEFYLKLYELYFKKKLK